MYGSWQREVLGYTCTCSNSHNLLQRLLSVLSLATRLPLCPTSRLSFKCVPLLLLLLLLLLADFAQ
jgi:hypothetical protein